MLNFTFILYFIIFYNELTWHKIWPMTNPVFLKLLVRQHNSFIEREISVVIGRQRKRLRDVKSLERDGLWVVATGSSYIYSSHTGPTVNDYLPNKEKFELKSSYERSTEKEHLTDEQIDALLEMSKIEPGQDY